MTGRVAPGLDARAAGPGLVAALGAMAILGVGVVAFALARAALLTDVSTWDTAEFQTVPPILGTLHPTGFPAYTLLGWLASLLLAPLGSPAFRMDLLSAILLGVAAAATAGLVRALTGRLLLGLVAGLGLATTPIVWRIGTRADAHALHLALVALLLLTLVVWEERHARHEPGADRWLLAAAAILGVAVANHRLIAFLAPGIVAYVVAVEPGIARRPRFVAACTGLALGVAAVLYLELPLRAGPFRAPLVYGHPETFLGFWYVALGVQFGDVGRAVLADPAAKLADLGALVARELGALAALVPAALLATTLRRPRYALLTLPAGLMTWFFAAGYANADVERYYLGPALFVWTWLAIAAGWLLDVVAGIRRPADRSSAGSGGPDADLGTAARAGSSWARGPFRDRLRGRWLPAAAAAIVAASLLAPAALSLPRRWQLVDSSHDATGRTWLEAALRALAPDAVVVSWWSYSTPLWYAQLIEGRRRDVWVVDDRTRLDDGLGDIFSVIDSNLGRRPVYAIRIDDRELARIAARYDVTIVELPAGQGLLRIDDLRDPSA